MDLREKVAEWIEANARMKGHVTAEWLADRILAIPEIAEALAAYEPDDEMHYITAKKRVALQRQVNEVRRAALDKLMKPSP